MSPRLIATVQAVAVCFVWSISFLITKRLYEYGVGPLTLTGLRFGLAAAVLAPLWWFRSRRGGVRRRLRPRVVIALGIAGYAVNPAGYHLALAMADASWVGVLLAVGNTLQVLAWSAVILGERPTRVQLAAMATAVIGIWVFAWPTGGAESVVPVLSVVVGGAGYALWVVGGRVIMREADPVALASACMLAGAAPTLVAGLLIEGPPRLPVVAWALIALLAVVNTACAFVVWNHTQRVLPAYESAIVNNTMTVQVALLAFAFLGDPLGVRQWAAIGVVTAAILAVQLMKPDP
ncbi:DMT family transporter [Nonomuraea sp. NPDC048826]|uniref:DMT family transporter n=1 Tax=Nonomuraea sp. NPDC048826 TaxID=3364347 RepID=UPI0037204276